MAAPDANGAAPSASPAAPAGSSSAPAAPAPAVEAPPALVPRCSAWFDLSKVNPIEKRMLPEFFAHEARYRAFPPGAAGSSSKTPQLYLKYRNYMVAAYRQQPSVFLTATACRRSLAGDACAILRVHEFLTHWGIINFDVPPHAMPPALNANYALRSVRAPSSRDADLQPVNVLVDAKAARGRQPRHRCELCARPCAGDGDFFELSTEAKRRVTSASGEVDAPANSSSNGKAFPGKDGVLTVGAFCAKPGSGICEECFLTRSFPDSFESGDFTRTASSPDAEWTQEELNRLLDAVSTSSSSRPAGDGNAKADDMSCDWNYVAAKVGTKTPEQCLLHFLELPLLDKTGGGTNIRELSAGARTLRPMVPGSALNASVVDLSELVSQADPLVAKAAARAAISAIKQLHTMPADENQDQNDEVVKTESVLPAASNEITDTSEPAAAETADTQSAPDTADTADKDVTMDINDAARAIADSNASAGVVVKTENATEADGDAVMANVGADPDTTDKEAPVSSSKETLAVLEEAASATTVALVATRAHDIAEATASGPMRDLVNQLLENQLQQMELKLKQLSVLEATLVAEREQLARERHELYMERLAFAQEKLGKTPAPSASPL